jgi:energy-converting hydrogenase Eha subunit B
LLLEFAPPSEIVGVGHGDPVEPLPEVRGADAVCANIRRRKGVAFAFHVCTHMVCPCVSSSAGNLLANNDSRAALADEVEERRP